MIKFINNLCPISFLILLACKILFNVQSLTWIIVLIPLFTWFVFYLCMFAFVGICISLYYAMYLSNDPKPDDVINSFKDFLSYEKDKSNETKNKE